MAVIVNLTPHPVHMVNDQIGDRVSTYVVETYPTSGRVARVATKTSMVNIVDGFRVFTQELGEVTGLPDPVAGTYYLVSAMVRSALPHRTDLISPGDAVRDSEGNIVGVTGFIINPG